jgi:small conductance mechanosensitive channel
MPSIRRLIACIAAATLLALPATTAGAQQAEETAPIVPTPVTTPGTDILELSIRLVPLTTAELESAAASWLDIVKAKTQEVAEAQVALSQAEGDAATAPRDRVVALTATRDGLFAKYSAVLDAWEKKGGDESMIAAYRAYRSAIVVEEIRTADARTLMKQAVGWATDTDGGIGLLIKGAISLFALIALFAVARMVKGFAGRRIERLSNLSKLLQAFLIVVIYWLTVTVGLMFVLSAIGVDITPLFAVVGGASFILAFALQDTLGNLASGLMIMINRPFDEGDYIDVGGVAGTVKNVSIVSTKVITPDNQVIVIPNSQVWGNVITNVTTSDTRRVDLVFGIGYEDDIEKASRVLEEVAAAHPLVLEDPEPVIRLHELADSSVNFVCRPWVRSADYWTVYWDLTRKVKERFDAESIAIPYPQRDIHLYAAQPTTAAQQIDAEAAARAGQDLAAS